MLLVQTCWKDPQKVETTVHACLDISFFYSSLLWLRTDSDEYCYKWSRQNCQLLAFQWFKWAQGERKKSSWQDCLASINSWLLLVPRHRGPLLCRLYLLCNRKGCHWLIALRVMPMTPRRWIDQRPSSANTVLHVAQTNWRPTEDVGNHDQARPETPLRTASFRPRTLEQWLGESI